MLFCGADLSITRSAFVFLDEQGKHVRTSLFGTGVKDSYTKDITEREFLHEFFCFTMHLFIEPTFIAMEQYAFTQGKNKGAHKLHEVGGILKLNTILVKHQCFGFVTIPPGTVKKFVTGKGNASKLEVFKQVLLEWDDSISTDDEADAYGLAKLLHLAWTMFPDNLDSNGDNRRLCAGKVIHDNYEEFGRVREKVMELKTKGLEGEIND